MADETKIVLAWASLARLYINCLTIPTRVQWEKRCQMAFSWFLLTCNIQKKRIVSPHVCMYSPLCGTVLVVKSFPVMCHFRFSSHFWSANTTSLSPPIYTRRMCVPSQLQSGSSRTGNSSRGVPSHWMHVRHVSGLSQRRRSRALRINTRGFLFWWMRNAAFQHRTDGRGWDVGQRNQIKHRVYFQNMPTTTAMLFISFLSI